MAVDVFGRGRVPRGSMKLHEVVWPEQVWPERLTLSPGLG